MKTESSLLSAVSREPMRVETSASRRVLGSKSHALSTLLPALVLAACSGTPDETPSPSPSGESPTPAGPTPTAVPVTPTPEETPPPPTVPPNELEQGDWLSSNADSLSAFGLDNASTDPRQAPVAVFNFDHVSIFNSAAEATFRSQLTNLDFKMTPGQFEEVLPIIAGPDYYTGGNVVALTAEFGNVSLPDLQADIVEAWSALYARYEPTGGCTTGCDTLEVLQATPEYKDFFAKLLFMYQGLSAHPEVGRDYTAVMLARLQAGFTETEIRTLAASAFDYERGLSIQEVAYASTSGGKVGKVSGSFVSGLRIYKETVDLYDYLRRNGFDVWVVSSAPLVVLQAVTSSGSGFSVNTENLIGTEVEREGRGQATTLSITVKAGVPIPYGEGKVDAVDSRIGKEPLLIVGGTDEDYQLITSFDSTALVLVMNRVEACPFAAFYDEATNASDAGVGELILQGLDDNTGSLRAGQTTILLGSDGAEVLSGCK